MAISTELLNSTFEDFRGPLVMGWQQNVPLRAMLMKKGKVSSEGGKYVERPLMTGAPARGVGIFNGDEVLDRTRYKKLKRLRVDFHRIVVSINIPNKELKQNTGKAAALSLINEYPKVVIEGIGVDREKYLLTGKSTSFVMDAAELYGYATLNGQFTAGVGTGVEQGFLDFRTPAQQNTDAEVVENIAKSTADYHYNQYGDIGNGGQWSCLERHRFHQPDIDGHIARWLGRNARHIDGRRRYFGRQPGHHQHHGSGRQRLASV